MKAELPMEVVITLVTDFLLLFFNSLYTEKICVVFYRLIKIDYTGFNLHFGGT